MSTIQKPVTGEETIPDSSAGGFAQFYRALNSRDLALMQQNWDFSDDAVMDKPRGGIKRGWLEISDAHRRLFVSPKPYRFEFYDYTLQRYGEVFLVTGRERKRLETWGRAATQPCNSYYADFSLDRLLATDSPSRLD